MEPKPGEWWIVIIDLGDREGPEIARWTQLGWQIVDFDGEAPADTCKPVRRLDLAALMEAP